MGRRLGQHFLRDERLLDRIVDALDPQADDVVLEIGPGEGTLTRRLAPRVGRVVAIERDPALARALGSVGGNVRVVEGDALTLAWHDLLRPDPRSPIPDPFKLIGNIPYYITSPLLEQALQPPRPACTVFLVQQEVAERVTSPPGGRTYGSLSVGIQIVMRPERLFTVRAGAFRPPPAVDSAVIRLTPRPDPPVGDEERRAFRVFVTALFGQRRKQLGRSLRAVAGVERDRAEAALTSTGVDPTARPETLSPERLLAVFRAVGGVDDGTA